MLNSESKYKSCIILICQQIFSCYNLCNLFFMHIINEELFLSSKNLLQIFQLGMNFVVTKYSSNVVIGIINSPHLRGELKVFHKNWWREKNISQIRVRNIIWLVHLKLSKKKRKDKKISMDCIHFFGIILFTFTKICNSPHLIFKI